MAVWIILPLLVCGWILVMYSEQLTVTGLYLYSTMPAIPVVRIIMHGLDRQDLPDPGGVKPSLG